MKKHIIVIGGGMAGTAAAYHLRKKGYKATILEKNDRLGGRIHSAEIGGTFVELGAGFLSNIYKNVLAFLTETSLDKQLFSQKSKGSLFLNKKIYSPIKLFIFMSLSSKLQLLTLVIYALVLFPWISEEKPETLALFDTKSVTDIFRKTGSKQVLEYIFQPILNGYCFWTPEQTSQAVLLLMTNFFIRGGRYRLQKGLQQIPQAAAKGSRVLLESEVIKVHYKNDVYSVAYKSNKKKKTIQADGVVCATTASIVPKIFLDLTAVQKKFFSAINYSSTGVVVQVYEQKKQSKDIALAIPRSEKNDVATITVSTKSHEGKFLRAVKVYLPGSVSQTDEEILKKNDMSLVRNILSSDARLKVSHVARWHEAIPVFETGSFKRLSSFVQTIEDPNFPLVFAGDYLVGPCIEWAFISGSQAAERLDLRFKSK